MVAVSTPYVPGFLAFREVPFLVEAVQRLEQEKPELKPQVLLVDGNGLLHPRGFGVACHLGVLTDLPCIGVAKNLLQVDGLVRDELHREQVHSLQRGGDTFPLTGASGTVLGMVLRSCNKSSKPLYVSVGHRVCLETAVRLVTSCCRLILDRGSTFGSSCVHRWRPYLLGQRAEKRRLNRMISLMAQEMSSLDPLLHQDHSSAKHSSQVPPQGRAAQGRASQDMARHCTVLVPSSTSFCSRITWRACFSGLIFVKHFKNICVSKYTLVSLQQLPWVLGQLWEVMYKAMLRHLTWL
ncbi:endonuclease V isoform 2-T2 [Porphyrio hochstetteri]